jgi:hypothetical protein
VRALVEAGWHIEAEGKIFRRPGEFRIEVSTGVDWFELHGGVEYGETDAKLPQLLEALRRGDNMGGSTTAPTVCCRRSGCAGSDCWLG